MTDISKAIKTASRKDYADRTETWTVVCALTAWKAIEPHMGGTWVVLQERRDDTETSVTRAYSIHVERSDGLRLWITGASNRYGDKKNTINVSAGCWEDSQGYRVDLQYTEPRGSIGSTTLDVSKRGASTLAKLITSKIVKPLEAKLPAIQKRLREAAQAQDSFAETCKMFRDAGAMVRESSKTEAYASLYGVSFRIGHGGSVRLEHEYMSGKTAVKVAKLIGDSKAEG